MDDLHPLTDQPVLVGADESDLDRFHAAAETITTALPTAEHRTPPGLNHGAVVMAPRKLAPAVVAFLTG